MLILKNIWNDCDYFGRASLLFRYAGYIFLAIYLFLYLHISNNSFNSLHIFTAVVAVVLPYLLFHYYVKNNNDKGIGIRQNLFDFFFIGWIIGLIHLPYIPTVIFSLGIICNYVAARGFHKLHRILLIPTGYLFTMPFVGFSFQENTPDIMIHLALSYAIIHFLSTAYISYTFSKTMQLINKKVTIQQKEILAQSEELKSLNDTLQSLNNHLEEKVHERTKELERKNEKLAEYTFINGHQLRAPVATMLGLCNLMEYSKEVEEKELLINKLTNEVKLLDITIKEIRLKLETDQVIVDKVKKVETEHSHFEKFKDSVA
ncbi:MASE2 domain-containing protein [Marivirga arenosa]|uniref:MASE2 domain-containing protein n=1 Tax=Marivirga arenosa TaxID=3059076 RepID=A0AA49GG66_9BACT|nr:MASE2 domain-containing protein [Marivirga sp. ABR2-2]WKK84437.2 MASE2 domain-containing protein [Marivirga sp. ABR2-2]